MSRRPAGIRWTELQHVVEDVKSLCGQLPQKVWVPSPESLVLRFDRRHTLYLETHPFPRLHPIVDRPSNPPTPFSFQGLLRARLRGPLLDVRVVGHDRIVELEFASGVIHARLFGRGGGLWWLEDGRPVAAADGPTPDALPTAPEAGIDGRPPRFTPEGDEGWGEAARRYFVARADAVRVETLRTRIRRELKKRHKKARRLAKALEGDLENAERSDDLRRQADCLGAILHKVPRGAERIEIPDLFGETGDTVVVELDPSRNPQDNMVRMYDKAGRLERAAEHVLERLDAAEREVEDLAAARSRISDADEDTLVSIARAHDIPIQRRRRRKGPQVAAPYQVWQGPGGREVWVGRSAKSNHELTFRRARGRDWWLHLRDRPGAHVILRHPDREPPSPELLLEVAQIVLHQARMPPGVTHDVQVARVSDLRPHPSGRPGQVAVHEERVFHVRHDPDVLAKWQRQDTSC